MEVRNVDPLEENRLSLIGSRDCPLPSPHTDGRVKTDFNNHTDQLCSSCQAEGQPWAGLAMSHALSLLASRRLLEGTGPPLWELSEFSHFANQETEAPRAGTAGPGS